MRRNNCPYNQKIRFYIGFPGSGKRTIASHATLYAACRGLNILVTCLANERAQILGGTHIHDVFALPVDSKPLGTLVAMSLEKLYKNQDKVSFLESLDFLNFDEIGLISAENIAINDAVFQHVKKTATLLAEFLSWPAEIQISVHHPQDLRFGYRLGC